jgi:hypothetical protein
MDTIRTNISSLSVAGSMPRATAEECMSEASYCLDQADLSNSVRARALCLGVAAIWLEVADLAARLDDAGKA